MWIPLDKAHYVMFCKITKMYEIAKAFLAEGLQIKIFSFLPSTICFHGVIGKSLIE